MLLGKFAGEITSRNNVPAKGVIAPLAAHAAIGVKLGPPYAPDTSGPSSIARTASQTCQSVCPGRKSVTLAMPPILSTPMVCDEHLQRGLVKSGATRRPARQRHRGCEIATTSMPCVRPATQGCLDGTMR